MIFLPVTPSNPKWLQIISFSNPQVTGLIKYITVSEIHELLKYGLSDYLDLNVDADSDFYWSVLYSEMFDFPEAPTLAVGSLYDDLKHLRLFFKEKIPFGESEIGRLSAVLKLIANKLESEISSS